MMKRFARERTAILTLLRPESEERRKLRWKVSNISLQTLNVDVNNVSRRDKLTA